MAPALWVEVAPPQAGACSQHCEVPSHLLTGPLGHCCLQFHPAPSHSASQGPEMPGDPTVAPLEAPELAHLHGDPIPLGATH